jgi:hypothetical protein
MMGLMLREDGVLTAAQAGGGREWREGERAVSRADRRKLGPASLGSLCSMPPVSIPAVQPQSQNIQPPPQAPTRGTHCLWC